ncbi:MAG: integrase family protein [Hydrogenophaga sp.]|nr:integrase family protein [Hydrogenophaga sp.]
MLFDAHTAKLLQPGERIILDDCPGLRLEAGAKLRTWVYRYKDDAGRMKQLRLGHWPAVPVQRAVSLWQGLRDKRAAGVDPVSERRAERAARKSLPAESVGQLVQAFLARYIEAERKADGARWARASLEGVLQEEPDLAACPVEHVTRSMAYQAIESRREYPAAAAKIRALLGQAWDWGRDAGVIDPDLPNWWRDVMRGRLRSKGKVMQGEHQGKQYRTLADDELRQLLPWALAGMHPNGRDGLVLYLWTGLRGAEIFGLRPEYISEEPDGWWLTYPAAMLKMERMADTVDHRAPLVGRALDVVRARMARATETGFLFESARGGRFFQYTQSTFSTYVYNFMPYSSKVTARASQGMVCPVPHWSPHDLRRTARTAMTRLGWDQRVAEAFIGHKPPGIVGVYDRHRFDAEKRASAPVLAGHMEGFVGG